MFEHTPKLAITWMKVNAALDFYKSSQNSPTMWIKHIRQRRIWQTCVFVWIPYYILYGRLENKRKNFKT